MRLLDRTIRALSPKWAWEREQYRRALAAYEAAKPSRLRKSGADNSSGDALLAAAGPALRGYARQLEQNYDVARGVLTTLVDRVVGPYGISWEPQPRCKDGNIHEEFAGQLLDLWRDWIKCPEVTHSLDYVAAERLACRTWFRDGELLVQLLEGTVPDLLHGSRLPFSFELIEADQLPFDYDDESQGITQGVERNRWGRPIAYHIYDSHPGDLQWRRALKTRRVDAERILHPKMSDRIRQARGVSVFASVLRRLEDLKDYEESERIAARVAAAMTGFIRRGTMEDYVPPEPGARDRTFRLTPGMVYDNLMPGEDVGTIESNRPSSLLDPFHKAMQRSVSAGTGAGYASISRNFDGSYSSRRQELVEDWIHYEACTAYFAGQFSRPIRERFVRMAILTGLLKVPRELDLNTLDDAEYFGPAMPWIDPLKEHLANKGMERAGHKSAQETIRSRGGSPRDTMDQIAAWRKRAKELGLVFDSDAEATSSAGTAQDYLRAREGLMTDDEKEE